jgi:hypothetical protein
MKSYNNKKKLKRHFPMDFYGDGEGWRFAVRAESPEQILAAKCWVACLSVRRRAFRIVDLAVDHFNYVDGVFGAAGLTGIELGTNMRIRRQGQVVTVAALNKRYGALWTDYASSVSSVCIKPANKIPIS